MSTTERIEMDCKDIAALLSGLIDATVEADVRHRAERHLAACMACAELLNKAESLDAMMMVGLDEVEEFPEGLERAVLAQTTRAGAIRLGGHRWFAITGWLAAAASLALAATVWMTQGGSADPGGDVVAKGGPRGDQFGGVRGVGSDGDIIAQQASYYTMRPEQRSALSDAYLVMHENEIVAEQPSSVGAGANSGVLTALALGVESATSSAVVLDRPMYFTGKLRLRRDDEETLIHLAELLEQLEAFDGGSMKIVDDLRRTIESEDLIARVDRTRQRLAEEQRFSIYAAESILWRLVNGPVDEGDVGEMHQMMQSLDLVSRIDRISGRVDIERAM